VEWNRKQIGAGTPDVRWRVITTTGAQFACRVSIIGACIEVWLADEHGQRVCTRVVASFDAATAVVRSWLRTIVADDGVEAVIASTPLTSVH
jgi:hypothetical protein